MGILGNLISATVKISLTPIAVVKDVVNVATGEEADSTKKHLKSVKKDLDKAGDYL